MTVPAATKGAPLVSVNGLTVRFGGIVALHDVSFDIGEGEICGLIGPNGAGKTTFFNCLSRYNRFEPDAIKLDGISLGRVRASRLAGMGVGRTFQNLALFGSLSVVDNILLGAHCHARSGVLSTVLRLPSSRAEERNQREEAWELARLVGLEAVGDVPAGELPFGFQKRIELGRALASRPRLLLLDEPAAGLIHEEVSSLGELIVDLQRRFNLTVILVEHHMGFVMKLCQRLVVLNFGRKIAEGTPAEIREHEAVRAAYLGAAA